MTSSPTDIERYVDAAGKLLDIAIDDAWRANIAAALAVTLEHGARLEQVELPDDAEPAPVFEA